MNRVSERVYRTLLCFALAASLLLGTLKIVPAGEETEDMVPAAEQAGEVTADADLEVVQSVEESADIIPAAEPAGEGTSAMPETAASEVESESIQPAETTAAEPGNSGDDQNTDTKKAVVEEAAVQNEITEENNPEGDSLKEESTEEERPEDELQEESLDDEEDLEENRPSGEEVAGAIQEIIEASSQMIFADQDGIERLQEYITETEEAFAGLSAEEQAALSGSIENLGHASAAVDVMQESMQQLEETGTIILEQSRNENSWRFIDGVPVKDALQVVEAEAAEVAEAAVDETLLLSDKKEDCTEVRAEQEDLSAVQGTMQGELLGLTLPPGEKPGVILVSDNEARNGIDVSEWQSEIDWGKVKESGIQFAIIRCGYGNDFYSQDDDWWFENVAACEAYDIPYGVYLYSKATTAAMIDSEVSHTLRLLEGHNPRLPVYLDVEENSQFLLGDAKLSKLAERYCSQILAAGYKTGVYTGTYGWTYYMSLFAKDDRFFHWVAQWNPKGCSYGGRYEMWQNEVKPGVPGIEGDVDRDIWYGAFPEAAASAPVPKPVTDSDPHIGYKSHVQTFGWEGSWIKDGDLSGTVGQSKRLEGIQIEVTNDPDLGVEYRTHVQTYGWESAWRADGAVSGTTGESKRLEAVQIRLTGADAENYDVYYCVHAQHFGWLNWAKNGEAAGTAGYGYRLEGIRVRIVKKGEAAPANLGTDSAAFRQALIRYNTHVQTYGWQSYQSDGDLAGTTGQSKRLEGIHIQLASQPYSGGIEYRTHIQTYGWETGWKKNGEMSGTTGQSKRLEAIQIRLTGEMAEKYDVYYQTHIQRFGWSGWAKNGAECGSAGYAFRLEGIRIMLVSKGGSAPGSTANTFYQK